MFWRGCNQVFQSALLVITIIVGVAFAVARFPSARSRATRNRARFSTKCRAWLLLREVTMTNSPASYFTNLPTRAPAAAAPAAQTTGQ